MPTRYKLAFLSESGQRIANENIKEMLKIYFIADHDKGIR